MKKIGVFGACALSRKHIENILKLKDKFELIGFFDPDPILCIECENKFNIKRFASYEDLIHSIDVVDIVSPILPAHDLAELSFKSSKHVFIEKPARYTLEQTKRLMSLSEEANVKVQVGNIERFNPAFLSAFPHMALPMFIEVERISVFDPTQKDFCVIQDLMIHDINIVLKIVPSNVKRITTSGVPIVNGRPDIANVRLEFDNGAVANLTASRIAFKNVQRMRVFQKNRYISIDYGKKTCKVFQLVDKDSSKQAQPFPLNTTFQNKEIQLLEPDIKNSNAIIEELKSFSDSIDNDIEPLTNLADGYRSLTVAMQVINKIEKNVLV
ncbi:MAG TPA: Gfo/Idh/MocA family oxidoreductase [Bacteroidetes bacterium]|nr:Gfo/Idh/MocA family oxidoreductase [Bacteroidota bacterium]